MRAWWHEFRTGHTVAAFLPWDGPKYVCQDCDRVWY